MPATASPTSDRVQSTSSGRTTYQQTYTIVDASTFVEASAAAGLPAYNDTLSGLSSFRVNGRNIRARGPMQWEATITWAVPEGGGIHAEPPEDDINRSLRVSWTQELRELPARVDVDGKPIRNAANFPPSSQPTLPVVVDVIRFTQWEPTINVTKMRTYRNRTNSNAFTLKGSAVAVGEMYCASIQPAKEVDVDDPGPVEIVYEFHWWDDNRVSLGTSAYPHDLHMDNVGLMGWWNDSGTKRPGPFGTKGVGTDDFTPTTEPVPLELDGTPVDASIQVGAWDSANSKYVIKTPVAPPVDDSPVDSPYSSTNYKLILFKRYKTANFAALNLFSKL